LALFSQILLRYHYSHEQRSKQHIAVQIAAQKIPIKFLIFLPISSFQTHQCKHTLAYWFGGKG